MRQSKTILASFLSLGMAFFLTANLEAQNAPYGAGTAEIVGTSLVVDGTAQGDHCSIISISGDRFLVVLNGKTYKLPAAGVTAINFSGQEGNDYLTNRTALETTANGGAGDDFLKTTKGVGIFYGGIGDDLLIGGPNDDVLCGGSDDDLILANGGDDQISGDATGTGAGGGGSTGGGGSADVDAQIVGSGAFAKGQFVQIGIRSSGTFGADSAGTPTGYVDLADGDRNDGVNLFGFIADTGLDGFTGGDFDGDFFVPGTPEEGFTLEIDDTNFSNNTNGDFEIPGMVTAAETGTTGDITWNGSVSGMDVQRKVSVFENGLFIRLEVILTNTTGGALNNVYFMNNVDPDNDQTLHGSYSTFNQIISQGDSAADNLSLVTAQQNATGAGISGGTEETGSALSLVAFDPRARVTHGGFSNRSASDVYDAVGSLEGTIGATRTADEAISLAFNIGTMNAGASETLVYYYSLDPTGIDVSGITDLENACSDPGEPGEDIIYGGIGDDVITTDEGDDIVYAGVGDDFVDSGNGNDRVYGQSGNDEITTGLGDDVVHGGGGADNIFTAAGDDQIFGNGGADTIRGGNGNDFIDGGSSSDLLLGQGDDDTIRGGGGNDFLNGGNGTDDLDGGSGKDTEIN